MKHPPRTGHACTCLPGDTATVGLAWFMHLPLHLSFLVCMLTCSSMYSVQDLLVLRSSPVLAPNPKLRFVPIAAFVLPIVARVPTIIVCVGMVALLCVLLVFLELRMFGHKRVFPRLVFPLLLPLSRVLLIGFLVAYFDYPMYCCWWLLPAQRTKPVMSLLVYPPYLVTKNVVHYCRRLFWCSSTKCLQMW